MEITIIYGTETGNSESLAREAREKQGRMYQVLGITAGAFLVILLL